MNGLSNVILVPGINRLFNYAAIRTTLGLSSSAEVLQHLFKSSTPATARITDERPSTGSNEAIAGASVLFDGTDDYVEIDPAIAIPADFSLAIWFKTSNTVDRKALLTGGTHNNSLSQYVEVVSKLEWQVSGATGWVRSTTVVADGEWHHAVFAWEDSTDTQRIYVDGKLEATQVATSPYTTAGIENVGESVLVGRNFLGNLSDARVYNKLLTDSEVLHIATRGKLGTDPTTDDCELWLKLEEAAETVVCLDSSGLGNHGTLTNATLSTARSTDAPYSHANNVGHSQWWNFNGSTSEIISDEIAPSPDTITIACWLNVASYVGGMHLVTTHDNFTPAYRFRLISNGVLGFDVDGVDGYSSTGGIRSTSLIPLNTPTHVAATYDGSNIRFYINGVLDATVAAAYGNLDAVARELYIGNWQGELFTEGDLFDVRIYDGALDASAIASIKDGGNPAGTLLFKSLNEGTSDETGNMTMTATDIGRSIVPRDESDPTKDVAGKDLQYNRPAKRSAVPMQSNCLTFDGTDDTVEIVDDPVFELLGDYTIAGWIYADNFSAGISDGALFSRWASSLGYMFRFANDRPVLYRDSRTVTGDLFGEAYDGTWIHIAGVAEGDNGRIYINGELSLDTTFTASATSQGVASAIPELGTYSNGAGSTIDGKLVDVRLFSAAKTETEIQAIMAGDDDTENLVEHWPLQEGGESDTAYGINGKHGTLTNFSHPAAWAARQDSSHRNLTQGFSNRLAYSNTGMTLAASPPNNTTISFDMKGTETNFILFSNGAAEYLLICENASSSVYLDSVSGVPDFFVDGVELTGAATRGELATILSDGETHSIVIEGINFAADGWTDLQLGNYNGGSSSYDIGDIVITNMVINGVTIRGDFVPAVSATLDAEGNTLNNPTGALHNGAETEIDMTGGVAAPWVDHVYRGYGEFDGISSLITWSEDFSFHLAWKLSFTITLDNVSGTKGLFYPISASNHRIIFSNAAVQVKLNGTNYLFPDAPIATAETDVVIEFAGGNGGAITATLGGVSQTQIEAGNVGSQTSAVHFGATQVPGNFLPATVKNLVIENNGATYCNCPLGGGNALDESGNNNHGIVTDVTFPKYTVPTDWTPESTIVAAEQSVHYVDESVANQTKNSVIFNG